MKSTGTSSGHCDASASTDQVGQVEDDANKVAEWKVVLSFLQRPPPPFVFLALALLPILLSLWQLPLSALEWVRKRLNNPELMKSCARRWESHSLCGVILKELHSPTFNFGVVHCGESSVSLVWHKLYLGRRDPVNTMCSSDEGLVCFCLTDVEGEGDGLQLVLWVVNPLTGACKMLPQDHGVSPFDLKMMQLVVDKTTRQYQVLLVHYKKEPSSSSGASQSGHELSDEEPVMEESEKKSETEKYPEPLGGVIFDSGTGVWRNARSSSQVFLGAAIHEERYVRDPGRGWKGSRSVGDTCMMDYQGSSGFFGPVAYDCATGNVITLADEWANPVVQGPHEFALSKDCLFELTSNHRLCESRIRRGKENLGLIMVKDDHLNGEARAKMIWKSPVSPLNILACEGYLLVRGSHFKKLSHNKCSYHVVGLLYDIRAGEWVDLLEDQVSDEDPPVESDEDSAVDTQVKAESSADEDHNETELEEKVHYDETDELVKNEEDFDETNSVVEEDDDSVEVKFSRFDLENRRQVITSVDHPHHFGFGPIMLCNLDWEAVP